MIKVKQKVDFVRRRRNRDSAADEAPKPGRIPRISRLMALAIRFDGLLRDGIVPDQSELARLGNLEFVARKVVEGFLLGLHAFDGREP